MLKKIKRLPQLYGDANLFRLPCLEQVNGRAAEIRRIRQCLFEGRVMLLTGGPGEGKSTVAARASKDLFVADLLPGGVFSMDMSGIDQTHDDTQAGVVLPDFQTACRPNCFHILCILLIHDFSWNYFGMLGHLNKAAACHSCWNLAYHALSVC